MSQKTDGLIPTGGGATVSVSVTAGEPEKAQIHWRPAARERSAPLTSREMEVLELLCEGLTYAEIGQRLGVAQRTARAHVVAVKEKLAAANNAQAVARGFERGLLRPPRAVRGDR
jgi:DNA-binding NarL/FixJ family response regulator